MASFHFCSLLAVVMANVWTHSQINGTQLWPDLAEDHTRVTAPPCIGNCCYKVYNFEHKYLKQYFAHYIANSTPKTCRADCRRDCTIPGSTYTGGSVGISGKCSCYAVQYQPKPKPVLDKPEFERQHAVDEE